MSNNPACPTGLLYAIRPGQTLARVGEIFGVGVDQLMQANPGIDPRNLQVGQVICVPGVADQVCRRGKLRVVTPGDTLFRISQETGVPVQTLVDANYWLPDPSVIYPGEEVCVPVVAPDAGCAIVLEPTGGAVGMNLAGVALIEDEGPAPRITFTAVNLPDPDVLGNYTTYVGDLVFREIERLVVLRRCFVTGQEVVWAGASELDVPPLGANMVAVFAFNPTTGERSADLLQGWIVDCKA